MRIRSLVALATLAAFGATACGGGVSGPKTLSDSEFATQLADICGDTQRSLDGIDVPTDLAGVEAGAGEAIDVLTDTRTRLEKILPPADLTSDFDDLKANVDDQLGALADLKKAGADKDEAAVNDLSAQLGELSNRRSALGDALGVQQCVNPATTGTTDVPATEAGAADAGTVPVTASPLTLPATVPPQSVAPQTVPADTTAAAGQLFEVVDLTTEFVAPSGFSLVNADAAAAQEFIDIVASVPELNTGIQQMGVSVLLDDAGTPIATIVLGIAIGDSMPGQWKDILCTGGILRTSDAGFTGIFCPGPAGSGVSEIFTLTSGDVGLSVATLVPDAPADLVVDAFYEANF